MKIFKDYHTAKKFCEEHEGYQGCGCGCGSGTMREFDIRGENVYEIQHSVDLNLNQETCEFKIGFIWINNNNPYL